MTTEIKISEELKEKSPALRLGIVSAEIVVEQSSQALWQEIDRCSTDISKSISLDTLSSVSEVKALRDVYKALGKEPSRYRGSAEALTRRILQGKKLYKVNNIVEINNLISLVSHHSVGSYDTDKIKFPAQFRIGIAGESYKGIGKETIDISGLPVFSDSDGPYGSPTSDSEKAMIRPETKNIIMVIISFTGESGLNEHMSEARRLLSAYASGRNILTAIL